ncbi:MAG TPA: hypothetical protein VFG68_21085 [Fimbriiglobus sp.]|nr:hypothetical protein [Fimbriiglobus sp.]
MDRNDTTLRPLRTLSEEDTAAIYAALMATPPKPARDWRDFAPKEHYTELQPFPPDDPLAGAWETYRREVGRLLDEGHAGKFVLIHGSEVIGTWATFSDARSEGERRFPGEPVLAYEVLEYHPVLRLGRAAAWLR